MTQLELIFHNEFDSSNSIQEQELHPLLTNPPYKLSLPISELITPKEKDEKQIKTSKTISKVNKKGAEIAEDSEIESNKPNRTKDIPCDKSVPRPHNAFIIFRTDYAEKVKNFYHPKKISIRLISQLASIQWQVETTTVKSFFQILADMYLQRHKIKYPNYKYSPNRRNSSNTINNDRKTKRKIESKEEKPSKKTKKDDLKDLRKEYMFTWNINDQINDSLELSSVSLSTFEHTSPSNTSNNTIINCCNWDIYTPENTDTSMQITQQHQPIQFIDHSAPPITTTTSPPFAPHAPPATDTNYSYSSQYALDNISLEDYINYLILTVDQPIWNQ
ncbi:15364_t:CDS:2 [Funneliformis geosporum]|uniref:15364_t:CDS:1 n=1 Tax=Funneliformis geosporum TaxID=1117311 RepID=A0A9W4SFD8_9GLOM|nr:15364_t:CDS:2 [Funneliformis geosporum]